MSRCERMTVVGLFALLLAWAGGGCGYRSGWLIPPEVETINIEVAANETFWRDARKSDNLVAMGFATAPQPAYPMTVALTEEIKNEVVRRTPLRHVREEDAESSLKATITDVRLNVLDRDAADNVVSARVEVVVDFVWTDTRNGRILARESGISRPTDYHLRQGENFTTAARREFEFIAERIVEAMQEDF